MTFSERRRTILFTSDPASNLSDLFTTPPGSDLSIEALDAPALWQRFLRSHLEAFLEIGDRGTFLDRVELRSLFELSVPGIDELMAWMRIGELAEENPDAVVVVDTAPTGHTLRMLGAGGHFRQLAVALDSMEEKHRSMVRQFMRRDVRDAMDAFIDEFDETARRRGELLRDPERCAFVPVFLSEPLVVQQTIRLAEEAGLAVPFLVLNQAVADPDCARDRMRADRDAAAREQVAPHRVVDAPRACTPLDSAERIARWSRGALERNAPGPKPAGAPVAASLTADRRLLFFAGKGGVGKTTCASSVAMQLALSDPAKRVVAISVDPAHSLADLFTGAERPANLSVETIDTREKWRRFRESLGGEIERAVDALTPRGLSVAYEGDALRNLIEIAPPGADELFAITRLADLAADPEIAQIVVDTAPTGHFLRLLDLPQEAGEWVREFIRLLLRYRELIPPGVLGEELVRASRALRELGEVLHSDEAGVVLVTRPERVVVAETGRLEAELRRRGLTVVGTIANYVTPSNDCVCDRSRRTFELELLARLGSPVVIERLDEPPALEAAARLVPLVQSA
jgi:arsenite-transporting ATPase